VLDSGGEVSYEARVPWPDGSIHWYLSTMTPLAREGDRITAVLIVASNVTALKDSEERVARLRSLLPICAWCDRIRTVDGSWETVEEYVERESGATVSHDLCPDCLAKELASLGH